MGGRLAVGLLVIVLLAVLVGFGALRGNVAFFASKGRLEPAAERHYRESIRRDFDTLEPLDARLDVCNVGGTIQGCYDASNAVINALDALPRDVGAADVPSRYVDGNEGRRHKEYAEERGVAAYLNKPVSLDTLIRLACEALAKRDLSGNA